MIVTRVEIYDLEIPASPAWHPVIVKVHTDEGLTGLGEVGLAYGTGHSAGAAMAHEVAQSFAIGADPFKTEGLWDRIFRDTFWAQGGGPVVYGAMSGLDTAMWDIKGKALGLPIHRLMGGKSNDHLRTYASQIQFGWGAQREVLTTPEQYARAARIAVDDGYDCVKIDPVMFDVQGRRNALDLRGVLPQALVALFYERVAAVRDEIGPDVDIILERHSFLGVASAQQMAAAWDDLDCFYYEEPVHYVSARLHDTVAQRVRIPTAAGERIYTRWGYRDYFEAGSLAVIQPDLGLVGGLTEGKKICDYAHTYDVTVQVHVCGSPIATAAALQLEAVIPNFLIHEHHTNALKAYNREICIQDYQPVGGKYQVPDLPGLGIDLNDDLVRRSPRLVAQ